MESISSQSKSSPATIPFELESLADAHRYQKWLLDSVAQFLGSRILELGSGIGNLSQHLPVRERLICSDIDSSLLNILRKKITISNKVSIQQVDPTVPLSPLLRHENLDTVVSFNVLEHVENDSELLRDMIAMLRASDAKGPKRIVTLVPAHGWAFGKVDAQLGHYRRYSDRTFKDSLQRAGVKELNSKNYYSRYMNLPALFAWWLNGRILGKENVGSGNMKAFELLCPIIRPVDDFLHFVLKVPAGNSLIAVFTVTND
jgi:SAM-dependent methyltransferase